MSNVYIELQNFIEDPEDLSTIPDRLKAELGGYYTFDSAGNIGPVRLSSDRLLSSSVTTGERNDQLLFPAYNHVINIYGKESEFRDQIQWREFVEDICQIGRVFENHSFVLDAHYGSSEVRFNYHDFVYEDYTKAFDTNLLLNYNLMNYRFNNEDEQLRKMSLIKSIYDSPNIDAPNSEDTFRQLLFEYPERIQDYSGSISDLDRKQRNIFDFHFAGQPSNKHGVSADAMPFQFTTTVTSNTTISDTLHTQLSENSMSKFIMQALKNNNIFRFLDYRDTAPNRAPRYVKGHDLINILINYDFTNFSEEGDELFLHQNESDLNSSHPSNRFVNTISRIRFLEEFRSLLKTSSQDYENVLNCDPSSVFSVGWKIEKYYLNDQTIPVQTYHISKHGDLDNFIDTQIKYGDVYIYKIYHLVAVLGNYYTYSELHYSDEEARNSEALMGADGVIRGFGDHDLSKTYGARVKVSVAPSFYVLEFKAYETQAVLNDRPTLPPEVVFYNESNKKNNIMIFLKTPDGEVYNSDYEFQRIGPSDEAIEDRLGMSRDNVYGTVFSNEHFTGIYEIYRMDTPPKRISDFENNFLVRIDQQAEVLSTPDSNGNRYNYILQYPNASYEDVILPHKKYYYLFRTQTYHGTPSSHSHVYEIELLQDSDETKIVVNEYKIPEPKDYSYTKTCKRLMRIVPNFEQLVFRNEFTAFDDSVLADVGFLESTIFNGMPTGKEFKIRITSKHTGKKMDINLRFKIRKSNF